jgi:hypothetical protein
MASGKRISSGIFRTVGLRVAAALAVAATVAVTMGQYTGQKLWWEAGDRDALPLLVLYPDNNGELLMYNTEGPILPQTNSFFQPLGTNGRACITCHQPSNAMSVSVETLRNRWEATAGKDPVFAAVDGSNCPTLPQAQRNSHSLLLERGLFRIFLPWPAKGSDGVPIQPEFTIEVVRDPTGCNTDAHYGLTSAHPSISVYRRPRMVANLKYILGSEKGFETGETTSVSSTERAHVLMSDGRESTLESQAVNAVLTHEQGTRRPTRAELQEILDFERQVFIAQGTDLVAGDLTEVGGPYALGAWNLGHSKPRATAADGFGVFLNRTDWLPRSANAPVTLQSKLRASVVRGNAIFASRQFLISDAANMAALGEGKPAMGTCATCHKAAMTGTDTGLGGMDVGTTLLPTAMDSLELPLFKITCNATAVPHPYRGRVLYTNDPGLALTTGKCSDVGSVVMQQFRGLTARAPYFANGSAKDLPGVVDFYDRRFNIHLSDQEKKDLVNFMSVL